MPKQPYTPPELPPKIDITTIISLLTDARDAVARYDEAVKRLPNPALIRRTFETQEAVLSSRIEGTQATLEEVLELDAEETDFQDQKFHDYQEISNYRRAIDMGKELLEAKPLSENVIKELHSILLSSVRGNSKQPGDFRSHQVHIGPPGGTIEEARYIPPVHTEIPRLISNLVNYLHSDDVPDRLIQIAIAHYQFEAIHPFADGNGRVGRILIPLYLYEKGITSYPNLYISEFLETHRKTYYEMLSNVSTNGDWVPWIQFFLRAVREQAKVSKDRVEKVEELHATLHKRTHQFNSIYASAFLDALFVRPIFAPKAIAKVAEIKNAQTLYPLIEKFVGAGLISDLTPMRERNKLYVFSELIDILES